jgi:DNA ligase (NAD+)
MNYLELKNRLIYLNNKYHNESISEVTDSEYDKLLVKLKKMEKLQGFADPDSPTQVIGSEIKHGRKVKHSEKMYSLDNVFSNNELNLFFNKYPDETYCCEAKIDGMSGNLTYKNGKLVVAATRGDGFVGENITENVLAISNIPKELTFEYKSKYSFDLIEVRGEFVIHKKDFEDINKKRIENNLEPFKNARNLVSGTMRGLNSKDVIERCVKFYAYGTTSFKELDYLKRRKIIEGLKFDYIPTLIIDKLEKVELIAQSIKDTEKEYPFEIDGVVIKLNSSDLQTSLGYTSKDPKWAVARKWNSEGIITELLDIDYQVGRTGVITPVAKLSPIDINGVTVSSATLHNFDEIKRLDLYKGCKVRVVRSGDVIPKIEGIYLDGSKPTNTDEFKEPAECPHCNSALENIGVKLYCSNEYCGGQVLAQLIYFASKNAMNIIDLDESTIGQLALKGFVRTYADFYKVTKRNLLALNGFAEKSAQKLLINIENSKQPSLDKFIVALGIPNVGQSTAKVLAKRFNSIENLRKADMLSLIELQDIGNKTANDIIQYFNSKANIKVLDDLLNYVKPVYEINSSGNELEGKVIVITGSFDSDRKEISKILENYGAKISSSVSSKTNLLIQGQNPGDNKIKDAIKNNILTVDYSNKPLAEIIESVFTVFNIPRPYQPF